MPNALTEIQETKLELLAAEIESAVQVTVVFIFRIGHALNEARAEFEKNDKAFGQWRQQRLPWLSRANALRFMQVDRRLRDKLLHQTDAVEIRKEALYLLAAPSTPDEVVDKAMEKAAQGETVTVAEIKKLKAKAKKWEEAAKSATGRACDWEDRALSAEETAKAAQKRVQKTTDEVVNLRNTIEQFEQGTEALRQRHREEAAWLEKQVANELKKLAGAANMDEGVRESYDHMVNALKNDLAVSMQWEQKLRAQLEEAKAAAAAPAASACLTGEEVQTVTQEWKEANARLEAAEEGNALDFHPLISRLESVHDLLLARASSAPEILDTVQPKLRVAFKRIEREVTHLEAFANPN